MHAAIDRLIMTRLCSYPPMFTSSCESLPVSDHLSALRLHFPAIVRHGTYPVTGDSLAGEVHAGFKLMQWAGSNQPTIIFHPAAGNIEFSDRIQRILPYTRRPIPANVFAVCAPYHESNSDFQIGMAAVNSFLAMITTSVRIIEYLIQFNRDRDISNVIVTGLGLGGFIAILHHIFYHTADRCVPLLSGPALDDVVFNSPLRMVVSKEALAARASIGPLLNFQQQFGAWSASNVCPVLARHDQFVRFPVQASAYGRTKVTAINRGHATASISYRLLRSLLCSHLRA